MRKITKFMMKVRTARTIFALHKMNKGCPTLRHLSSIWSIDCIVMELTKNITADVAKSADVQIITNVLTHLRVRMNGIESVVILTLPMHLRE